MRKCTFQVKLHVSIRRPPLPLQTLQSIKIILIIPFFSSYHNFHEICSYTQPHIPMKCDYVY